MLQIISLQDNLNSKSNSQFYLPSFTHPLQMLSYI